jgi:drug/metabolite transporter (DMT)-like permease
LGAIIGAIFPLWIVVIGLFNKENKMPLKAITGMILGFGGVCLIFYDHLHDFLNKEFQMGILFSLIATWTWAFATLYTKKQAVNFNPYFSLGLQMLISGVCLFFTGKWNCYFNDCHSMAILGLYCLPGHIRFVDRLYLLFVCITKPADRTSFHLCLY